MKTIATITLIALISFIIFAYMSYASNRKVERQKYTVVKQEDGFEIRFYPKAIMATVSSLNHGEGHGATGNFRVLAGYIFGGNKEQKSIPMTAPVHMEKDTNANKMSFVLPSAYELPDLPHPNDTNIKIHYSEEGYYAALHFGGFARDEKIKKKEEELKELLRKKGYETIGAFVYLGYNAPWEVINRENEIIVKVNYAK